MRHATLDRGGFALMRTLNARERAGRRRAGVLAAVLALALGAGLFGALTAPPAGPAGGQAYSPLSYISVQ